MRYLGIEPIKPKIAVFDFTGTGASPDTNFSHYDQIDPLIETARLARNPADQVRFWKQAQIKLLDDAVAYPLHYVNLSGKFLCPS